MTSWVEQVERRARMIHFEIAGARMAAARFDQSADEVCERLYALLREIYEEDLPLAKAKDNSELLLHVEGRGVHGIPRLSLVSGLFNNVRVQVRDLTKTIMGMPDKRVSASAMDLGLSGLARGSLFIGFSAATPRDSSGQDSLLGGEDELFKATQHALSIINELSHSIDVDLSPDMYLGLGDVVPDPQIRDAALVAIRRIAPSGKRGISTIGITSATERRAPAELTPATRKHLGEWLVHPVIGSEQASLVGTVREVDLDARRFELRAIDGFPSKTLGVRCVLADLPGDLRGILDTRIRVSGVIERRQDGTPRLMQVEALDLI